jgi:hypothetical protein
VGEGEPYGSVGEALAVEPGKPSAAVMLTGSATEPGPVCIAARNVKIQGHPDTLDGSGRPTAVLQVSGITIGPDASLRLENLIIDGAWPQVSASGEGAALLSNKGRLSIENCVIRGGAHGIHQVGGTLRMTRVYVRDNARDGIFMEGGYAELVNCEFVNNGGNGLKVTGGDARLTHCGCLGNVTADVAATTEAAFKADNCLFGSVAPMSVLSLMRNCLAEVLPDDAVVAQSQACLLNTASGCSVKNGRIEGLNAASPCVDAGLHAGVETDIVGRPRDDRPDIGPLEYIAPPAAPAPEHVPAFSGIGLGLFSLLLAGVGIAVVRRKAQER